MGVDPDSVVGRMTAVVAFKRPEDSESIAVFRPGPDR